MAKLHFFNKQKSLLSDNLGVFSWWFGQFLALKGSGFGFFPEPGGWIWIRETGQKDIPGMTERLTKRVEMTFLHLGN